jgi:histidyl-tRNA synthetase
MKWGDKSRAILGGGRYDNLVADVGGNPCLVSVLPWVMW